MAKRDLEGIHQSCSQKLLVAAVEKRCQNELVTEMVECGELQVVTVTQSW